ncbi:hypothetical protein M426DRAFT_265263 [Hypoxylon sp. CI-4A]|nr:hypothetical protein M426DRAFT_265263 [Hypoxylon sp. CI-4A]
MPNQHMGFREGEIFTWTEHLRIWRTFSIPQKQFEDMVVEEMSRIWDADPRSEGRTDKLNYVHPGATGGWLYDQAYDEIKAQWIEQGIWRDGWDNGHVGPRALDTWKHEEPLPWTRDEQAKPMGYEARFRPKFREEVVRKHEASRPIHQFHYQMQLEVSRLTGPDIGAEGLSQTPENLNTQAYDAVRLRWRERRIWDEEWGTLPGMAWKHEKPPLEYTDDEGSSVAGSAGEGEGLFGKLDDDDDDDGREQEGSGRVESWVWGVGGESGSEEDHQDSDRKRRRVDAKRAGESAQQSDFWEMRAEYA